MGSNSAFLKSTEHFMSFMKEVGKLSPQEKMINKKNSGKSRKTKIEKAAERSPEEQKELDENYKESVERTIDEDKTELAKLNYDFKRLSVRKLGIDEMINGKDQDSLFSKKYFIAISLLFSIAIFLPFIANPTFIRSIFPMISLCGLIAAYIISWIQTQTKKIDMKAEISKIDEALAKIKTQKIDIEADIDYMISSGKRVLRRLYLAPSYEPDPLIVVPEKISENAKIRLDVETEMEKDDFDRGESWEELIEESIAERKVLKK